MIDSRPGNVALVMYSKHDELDKEMDLQKNLCERRRIRIETNIHNVRAGKPQRRTWTDCVRWTLLLSLFEWDESAMIILFLKLSSSCTMNE